MQGPNVMDIKNSHNSIKFKSYSTIQKLHNSIKFKSYFTKDIAFDFAAMRDEDIAALKVNTTNHFLCKYINIYWGFVLAVSFVLVLWQTLSFGTFDLDHALVIVYTTWFAGFMIERITKVVLFEPKELLKYLTPLSKEPELCAVALKYCEKDLCAEYRESVLNAGREFLKADFLFLEMTISRTTSALYGDDAEIGISAVATTATATELSPPR